MNGKKFAGLAAIVATLTIALPLAIAQHDPNYSRPRAKADASPGASVSQIIGPNSMVTIDYHRPAVKGRDVWAGTPETAAIIAFDAKPWRAGANEATMVTFADDVTVEGKPIAKGTYSFYIIPSKDKDWTLIFNKTAKQWGTNYDEAQDALRVTAKPADGPAVEWLTYTFDDLALNAATATLHWGTKKVGFRVELPAPAAPAAGAAAAPAAR